ncbi:MAG TPA: hypothetical protein VJ385_09790 [Fibrobacteria bacterium]|nr:hypothetical protein [Fibrobacteria bacterium]
MSRKHWNGSAMRPFSHLRRSARSAMAMGLIIAAAAASDNDVELEKLHAGASLYFGQIFDVNESMQETGNFNPTVTIPLTSLWMIQQAKWKENFSFNLGIAGSFFYPFPEDNTKPWKSFRTGGVAIAQANGSYTNGEGEHPWLKITVGQQGYKYNPYAKNFGEYLYRSEAYPTTIHTGDWGAIDNAGAGIWGASVKMDFLNGMIRNDFIVSTANERVPLHDVSFTDIATLNLGKAFSIGGGVMLSRLIEVDPKKSAPHDLKTGWITWTAADQANLRAYIKKKTDADPNFLSTSADFKRTMMDGTTVIDTSLVVGQDYWALSRRPLVSFLNTIPALADPDAVSTHANKYDDIAFVDARTVFLMAKASFDPKALIGLESPWLGANDLVIYGEAAIIGMKNYPIYYTSTSQRSPFMAGFYLPTLGFLDFFTVEMEFLKNPHVPSDYQPATFRQPQPKGTIETTEEIPGIADPFYDVKDVKAEKAYNINYTDDDVLWTVTALKSWGPMSLAAQYGRDHYRPLTAGFSPTATEVASSSKSKYYMIRLMVNF